MIPVSYGDGVADRIREAAGGRVDAFIDTVGGGYVELALELGVAPERIDTIADFEAGGEVRRQDRRQRRRRQRSDAGRAGGADRPRRARGPDRSRLPARPGPDAYRELERNHTQGKIVLTP